MFRRFIVEWMFGFWLLVDCAKWRKTAVKKIDKFDWFWQNWARIGDWRMDPHTNTKNLVPDWLTSQLRAFMKCLNFDWSASYGQTCFILSFSNWLLNCYSNLVRLLKSTSIQLLNLIAFLKILTYSKKTKISIMYDVDNLWYLLNILKI